MTAAVGDSLGVAMLSVMLLTPDAGGWGLLFSITLLGGIFFAGPTMFTVLVGLIAQGKINGCDRVHGVVAGVVVGIVLTFAWGALIWFAYKIVYSFPTVLIGTPVLMVIGGGATWWLTYRLRVKNESGNGPADTVAGETNPVAGS